MLQTLSSTKSINNNPSIGFANDNFCAFLPNNFLNYLPSSAFKNPHSPQNASSLFCAFGLKTTRAGVCGVPLQNPFSLKSAVKADFLTLEPGNDLNINTSGNLWNNASTINAKNNINLNVGSLTNNSYIFRDYHYIISNFGFGPAFCGHYGLYCGDPYGYYLTGGNYGYINQPHYYNALIKAGNNLNLNSAGNVVNNTSDAFYGNYGSGSDKMSGLAVVNTNNKDQNTAIGNISLNTLASTGKIDIDYSKYTDALTSGNVNIGAYKIADPTSNYLFESRTDFLDQSKYFNSQYYFNIIGFNPSLLQAKMIGDARFQHEIIRNQLIELNLREKSLASGINDEDYITKIRTLYDNAITAKNDLGLEVGTALTDSQRI